MKEEEWCKKMEGRQTKTQDGWNRRQRKKKKSHKNGKNREKKDSEKEQEKTVNLRTNVKTWRFRVTIVTVEKK